MASDKGNRLIPWKWMTTSSQPECREEHGLQLANLRMVRVLWYLIVKSQIAALMNDCLGQNMDLSTIHFPIRKASLQTLQAFWLLINHVQIHEGEAQATAKAFQLLFNYMP